MNMNQILKQAQAMQKDMMKAQEEVAKMTFTASKDLVTVEVNGNRKVTKVTLSEDIDTDDIEMLEDMIMIATNDALAQAEAEMEKRLGKYSKGMPGLF
jgi:DNA-binding YbaB/EbfC family protein